MLLMIVMPTWGLLWQMFNGQTGWLPKHNYLLLTIGAVTLVLQAWMVVAAALVWPRAKGMLEEGLPPLKRPAAVA
jgi:carbon starvation protein